MTLNSCKEVTREGSKRSRRKRTVEAMEDNYQSGNKHIPVNNAANASELNAADIERLDGWESETDACCLG